MNMACAKSAERESGQIGGLGVLNIEKKRDAERYCSVCGEEAESTAQPGTPGYELVNKHFLLFCFFHFFTFSYFFLTSSFVAMHPNTNLHQRSSELQALRGQARHETCVVSAEPIRVVRGGDL